MESALIYLACVAVLLVALYFIIKFEKKRIEAENAYKKLMLDTQISILNELKFCSGRNIYK